MKSSQKIAYLLLPPFMLFMALVLFRFQIFLDLNVTFKKALSVGLAHGWLNDAVMATLPLVLMFHFQGLFSLKRSHSFLIGAFLIWGVSLSDTLYFRYFQSHLEWWVIQYHWNEVFHIQGSAAALGTTSSVVVSGIFFTVSVVLAFRYYETPITSHKTAFNRMKLLGVGSFILVAALLVRQSPRWFRVEYDSIILAEHVLNIWQRDMFKNRKQEALADVMAKAKNSETDPEKTLVHYREFSDETSLKELASKEYVGLRRNLNPPIAEVIGDDLGDSLRRRLGFRSDARNLNFVVLFLESLRAFELYHPDLGYKIFPKLKKVLAEKSIQFTQAYSSSAKSALTVRGQFSTMCSNLPNLLGPPVYVAHSSLRIKCLQDLAKENGYQTVWFHSLNRTYSKMSSFESLHGMDLFFDEPFFREKGITEQVGLWGLADKPFLNQTLQTLEEMSTNGKGSFFSSVLTVSTHHPHSELVQAPIPKELRDSVSDKKYRGFLSHFNYLDQALDNFFTKFFESKLADNTVIFLLADHSVTGPPHYKLSTLQQKELLFRIPIAVISKNIKPEVIHKPVHQVDVAPTLARIANFKNTEVAWVGQGLFAKEGRPFVYEDTDVFMYRTRSKVCYQMVGEKSVSCGIVSDSIDPLFQAVLESIPEDKPLTSFFKEVIEANRLLITLNRLFPFSE